MSEDIARIVELVYGKEQGFDPSKADDNDYMRLGEDSYKTLVAKINAAMSTDFVVGIEVAGQTQFLPQPLLEPPPVSPMHPKKTEGDDTDI